MAEVLNREAALWLHRGAPPRMDAAHRHDDIELNFVVRGRLEYLFGGRSITVAAGRLAVFWGATPHQLVTDLGTDVDSDVCWLHLPLTDVLGWGLPTELLARLMLDQPVVVDGSGFGDLSAAFDRWAVDLAAQDSLDIALLEAQALVRRALRAPTVGLNTSAARTDGLSQSVAAMATYIATRFRDPIRVTDVAEVAHLHPSSAMSAFRSALGVTISQYLTRCRVAEAQRLLITTDGSVGDIAAAAGFGSQSAFYEVFTRATGRAPATYRRAIRSR
jgi:AraC family transcriptional regulator, melibiose operon regulatory protein